jgi:hypothetical protein
MSLNDQGHPSNYPGSDSEIFKPENWEGRGRIITRGYKIRPEIFGEEIRKSGVDYFYESGKEKSLEAPPCGGRKLI